MQHAWSVKLLKSEIFELADIDKWSEEKGILCCEHPWKKKYHSEFQIWRGVEPSIDTFEGVGREYPVCRRIIKPNTP